MTSGAKRQPIPGPQARAVRQDLDRILKSSGFVSSPRLQRLLDYVVEETLAGRGKELKEYTIATEVFERPPGFDPKDDTIVRVQARRLRQRLTAYYEQEGRASPVVIKIPKGAYAAQFVPGPEGAARPENRHRTRWKRAALFASCGLGLFLCGLILQRHVSPNQPNFGDRQVVRRYRLDPPTGAAFPIITADGRHVLYLAADSLSERSLWIWDLDRLEPRPLKGAEGAWGYGMSPTGDRVAFLAEGELKILPTAGGPARSVTEVSGESSGLRWSWDGQRIVFAAGNPSKLYEVSAEGGPARPLLSDIEWEGLVEQLGADSVPRVMTPYFLPLGTDRRVLVFAIGKSGKRISLVAHDLDRREMKILGPGGYLPRYSKSGHIVYSSLRGEVWAQPFSLEDLSYTGDPFRIIHEAGTFASVSLDGTLVYPEAPRQLRKLVWRNRIGAEISEVGETLRGAGWLRLAPDGKRASVFINDDVRSPAIFVYDLATAARIEAENNLRVWLSPETPRGAVAHVWSPDGHWLAFSSASPEGYSILRKRTDGVGLAAPLLPSAPRQMKIVLDWSRDGKYLLFRSEEGGGKDLGYLRLEPDGSWTAHRYVDSPADEDAGAFSPNGQFVAHVSGGDLVVRPFPEADRRQWPVSPSGVVVRGRAAKWTRDGAELIYAEPIGRERITLTAVEIAVSGSDIVVGGKEALFEIPADIGGWDVTDDGERFLVAEPAGQEAKPGIIAVENWYEEFRNREQD